MSPSHFITPFSGAIAINSIHDTLKLIMNVSLVNLSLILDLINLRER